METTNDRSFAEVRARFEQWRRDEEGDHELREIARDHRALLCDYRAGLVTDRQAMERMAFLMFKAHTLGYVEALTDAEREPVAAATEFLTAMVGVLNEHKLGTVNDEEAVARIREAAVMFSKDSLAVGLRVGREAASKALIQEPPAA